MSKTSKQVLASILAYMASIWMVAYVMHLFPAPLFTYWFGFPLITTSVIFVIAASVAGATFPFKDGS